jgi:hypothetical protein
MFTNQSLITHFEATEVFRQHAKRVLDDGGTFFDYRIDQEAINRYSGGEEPVAVNTFSAGKEGVIYGVQEVNEPTKDLFVFEIRDTEKASRDYYQLERLVYESDLPAESGSLIKKENTVFCAPHNKMLNLIDGVWYLNDTVSTTPIISVTYDLVEEVTQDTFVKAIGSIIVTDFRERVVQRTLGFSIDIGDTTFWFEILGVPPDRDPIYLLSDRTDQIKRLAKYIYQEILVAFGFPKPEVINIKSGDNVNLTIGTYTVTATYLESRGLTDDPNLASKNLAGVEFVVNTAEGIIPIPINVEIFFNDLPKDEAIATNNHMVDVEIKTKNIEDGRGNFTNSNPVRNALIQNKEYWYKARYVFQDGHKTKTCYPVYAPTTASRRLNILRIEDAIDLDTTLADIEIFRKTGSGEFYLIDRLRNPVALPDGYVQYIDDGKIDQSLLNEQFYVWTKSHKTHAVIRDRYVKANVGYQSRENEIQGEIAYAIDPNGEALPPNANIELIAQNRFTDGLTSFHKVVNRLQLPYDSTQGIQSFSPVARLTSRNSDSNEVAWFYRYVELDPKDSLTILATSLANLKTPFYKPEGNDVGITPTNPSFFIGYRYLYKANNNQFFFADVNKKENTNVGVRHNVQVTDITTGQFVTTGNPDYVRLAGNTQLASDVVPRNRFLYKRIPNTNIWEFNDFEALRELILSTNVTLKLKSFAGANNVQTDNIRDIEVRVTDIVDNSVNYDRDTHGVFDGIDISRLGVNIVFDRFTTTNSGRIGRMYLTVETGTELDITQDLIQANLEIPYLFNYEGPNNTFKVVNTRPPKLPENLIVYLGKDTEEFYTGVEKVEQNNAVYWRLKESNIYETFVGINDLDTYQDKFPNQLIWSEPQLLGTNITGSRTTLFTNVLNIQNDYGDIVRIEPLGNRLIVFTERGVAIVVVGEQLTQTPSGETFVQGINFLNSPVWLLKNIESVQIGTIKQYQNNLIFSDGKDVYRLGDQIENLSNGAIDLGVIRETYLGYEYDGRKPIETATMWATIDPKNREYRISNGKKTYCYNFDMNGWTGPHDYSESINISFGDRSFGVVEGEIIEHNIGNTRSEKENGPDGEYVTTIQSTSNDLGNAWVTKLFRKFYVEQDGDATFSYSNDDSDYTDVDLSKARTVAGLKHVGVQSQHQNSRYMFWKVMSQAQDFVLKLMSFEYTPRNRR